MKQSGGLLNQAENRLVGEIPTETFLPNTKSCVSRFHLSEVHAFRCNDNIHLFVWINQTGVKFISRPEESYESSKAMFLSQVAGRLNAQSVSLHALDGLNHSIIEKVETFIL
jgi:hypothetical protein